MKRGWPIVCFANAAICLVYAGVALIDGHPLLSLALSGGSAGWIACARVEWR